MRRYCLDKEKHKDNSSRMSLLEKLRKKLSTATASQDEESDQEWRPSRSAKNPSCSKNAVKSSRKFELGWIHEGKQMRKRSGGGTRTLDESKKATKADILSHAKELLSRW